MGKALNITKSALLALVLAACVTLAGCEINVHSPWPRLALETRSVTISPTVDSYTMSVRGGSGDFLAEISNADVADVHVEATYGGPGHVLVIEPKKEGVAIITVIDRKTAAFELCSLTVTMDARTIDFRIVDVVTNVDADNPEVIEANLNDPLIMGNELVKGGGIDVTGDRGVNPDGAFFRTMDVVGADNRTITMGAIIEKDAAAEWSTAYDFLPIKSQIRSSQKWQLSYFRNGWDYDVFFVDDHYTRMSVERPYHVRLYQDLTEYYKAKYPDAGVRSVARVLISDGSK